MGKEEIKILVVYVGVAGVRGEDIQDTVEKIVTMITPETFEGEILAIPTQSYDTKIECINPKYITNEELIKEHTQKMEKLKVELEHQINQLKDE